MICLKLLSDMKPTSCLSKELKQSSQVAHNYPMNFDAFPVSPEHVEQCLLVGLDVPLHGHELEEFVERNGVVRPVDGHRLGQGAGLFLCEKMGSREVEELST